MSGTEVTSAHSKPWLEPPAVPRSWNRASPAARCRAAQCEKGVLKSTSTFCHFRANLTAQLLLHLSGRGSHPWSELGLIFGRMSRSAEWVEDFSSFLKSTAVIHNRNKWCIVLPFIREQFWMGWGGDKRAWRGSSVHPPIIWGSVFPHKVNRDCQCHGHTPFLMLHSALCRRAFSKFNPQCSWLKIIFTQLGIYPGLTLWFLQQPLQPKQWHRNPRKSFTHSYLIKQPFK